MAQTSLVGQTLAGRYQIDELIGQGGMSAVYKATDPNLKRVVAIKVIHPHLAQDPRFISRFEEEAASVAQLRHPNIVQVFDFAHDGDLFYMVQEFIPGETLHQRLARSESSRPLSFDEAIQYTAQICDAAEHAHRRGMIHRDIKPANIMLNIHGQAILMDFGIVRITGSTHHTATGAVVGTALYMAPEVIRGETPDARSDLYSLGITLYEMVSGQPPFKAESAMTLMMMHLQDPVPDPRQLRADVPGDLVAVIHRAVAKDPNQRYQSMAEMAAALRQVGDGVEGKEALTLAGAPDQTRLDNVPTPVPPPAGGLAPTPPPVLEPAPPATTPGVPLQAVRVAGADPASAAAASATPRQGRRIAIIGLALLALALLVGAVVAFWRPRVNPTELGLQATQTAVAGQTAVAMPTVLAPTVQGRSQEDLAATEAAAEATREAQTRTAATETAQAQATVRGTAQDYADSTQTAVAGQTVIAAAVQGTSQAVLDTAKAAEEATATAVAMAASQAAQAQADATETAQVQAAASQAAQAQAGATQTAQAQADATQTAQARAAASQTAQAQMDATQTAQAPASGARFGRLAFSSDRDGNPEIYVVDLAHGSPERLTSNSANDWLPDWSPDGTRLAFTSNRTGSYDTWVMSGDGGGQNPWVTTGAWDDYPRWAPDGQRLSLSTTATTQDVPNSEIFVREPNGNLRQVTNSTAENQWADWSPDGRIIYAEGFKDDSNWNIYIVNGDGTHVEAWMQEGTCDVQPTWSPNGQWIAFLRVPRDTNGNGRVDFEDAGDVWVGNAAGGGFRQLTSGLWASTPAWSPDGEWIAFARHIDSNGNGQTDVNDAVDIWAVPLSGGQPVPLLQSSHRDQNPTWSW